MSAPLDALRAAILTNTLNAGQQTALANALAIISPAFPEPDEISNSIPQDEEVLARDWMAALYAVQAGGGTGGLIPVQSGTLILPDGAALSGTAASGLPTGQPAIVNTFGAEFSLQPIGTLVVDGSTVLSSTDPTRVWERGDTVVSETARAQTQWTVDRVAGNNEATGLPGHPVREKAEIARRYGSWSPDLVGVNVTIGILSPDTTGTDPGLFSPNLIDGATFTIEGFGPPSAFTGTLNAVTPKSQAANQALMSTFTTTTGAITPGMVLTNATRSNSVALVVRDTGGGHWLLSQPLTPYVAGTIPNPSEVDTWAPGDSINGVIPPSVDIGFVAGNATSFNASFSPSYVLRNMTIIDSDPTDGGAGTLYVESSANFYFDNCVFVRNVAQAGESTAVLTPAYGNCGFNSQANLQGRGNTRILGGYMATGALLDDCLPALDLVLSGSMLMRSCTMFSSVYYDTGTTLTLTGENILSGGGVGLYGPGQLDNQGIATATEAAATSFPGPNLLLASNSQAYSNVTTGGVVAVHRLALTTVNLGNAAGATGFGGMAWNGGCAYIVGGVAP